MAPCAPVGRLAPCAPVGRKILSLPELARKLRFLLVPVRPKFFSYYRTSFGSRMFEYHYLFLIYLLISIFYPFYQLSDLHIKLDTETEVTVAVSRNAADAVSCVSAAVVAITTPRNARVSEVADRATRVLCCPFITISKQIMNITIFIGFIFSCLCFITCSYICFVLICCCC